MVVQKLAACRSYVMVVEHDIGKVMAAEDADEMLVLELDEVLQAVARHDHQAEGPRKKEKCFMDSSSFKA
jgi:hypothetical protein